MPLHPAPLTYYNIRTIHHIAVTTVLRSWMTGIRLTETCWADSKINKIVIVASSWSFIIIHLRSDDTCRGFFKIIKIIKTQETENIYLSVFYHESCRVSICCHWGLCFLICFRVLHYSVLQYSFCFTEFSRESLEQNNFKHKSLEQIIFNHFIFEFPYITSL